MASRASCAPRGASLNTKTHRDGPAPGRTPQPPLPTQDVRRKSPGPTPGAAPAPAAEGGDVQRWPVSTHVPCSCSSVAGLFTHRARVCCAKKAHRQCNPRASPAGLPQHHALFFLAQNSAERQIGCLFAEGGGWPRTSAARSLQRLSGRPRAGVGGKPCAGRTQRTTTTPSFLQRFKTKTWPSCSVHSLETPPTRKKEY